MGPTIGPFAKTVGPAIPFKPVVRGFTGNLSIPIDAGQITLIGQAIDVRFGAVYAYINRNVGPALPFQAVKRGYTAPLNINVDIAAGQVTFAGQQIQVDLQSPRISGVKWDPGPYFEFSPRRPAYTALPPGNITVPIDTPGQITLSGQSITAGINVPFAPGHITIAGQSFTARLTVNIDAGAVLLQGQAFSATLGGSINLGFEGGQITFQGQDIGITLTTTANLTPTGSRRRNVIVPSGDREILIQPNKRTLL